MDVYCVAMVLILSSAGWGKAMDNIKHQMNSFHSPYNQKTLSQSCSNTETFEVHNGLDFDIHGICVKDPYGIQPEIVKDFHISKDDFIIIERSVYKDLGMMLYLDQEYNSLLSFRGIPLEKWRMSGLRQLVIFQKILDLVISYRYNFCGSDCPICWKKFKCQMNQEGDLAENVRILECGHTFHEECVQDQVICPVCRRPIGTGPFECGTTRAAISSTIYNVDRGWFRRLRSKVCCLYNE